MLSLILNVSGGTGLWLFEQQHLFILILARCTLKISRSLKFGKIHQNPLFLDFMVFQGQARTCVRSISCAVILAEIQSASQREIKKFTKTLFLDFKVIDVGTLESLSAVLIIISNKSMSICKRVLTRVVNIGRNCAF